ncbi:conserved Plasmodium protein, unknown function [Plasmodium vinckei lentum]|uniref:Uncharacterized protein n=1 Tax=Plasmodium vinckei lentum TaxID=138297 RepID=A0A6V7S3H9_PLAVN|nr:conserved Plasmodium protein, unknown function [Plasmodium vinckei lentum]
MENINKKDVFVSFFKMCDKNNIANVIQKYCDDDHGVVLNSHPAKNEEKFGSIYDYAISSQSKKSETQNASSISSVSNVSISIPSSKKVTHQNSSKSIDGSIRSICFYKNTKSQESMQTIKDEIDVKVCKSQNKNKKSIKEDDEISKIIDSMCEIMAPEGKGKFLKFIGGNYVYVLLENGTYNCYPIEMLKLNRGYLKTNAMYNTRFNCKDVALNHTRNILKQKGDPMNKQENDLNRRITNDEFFDFSNKMSYIKDYIVKNDTNNESIPIKNYLIKQVVDNSDQKYEENNNSHLMGYHNLVKEDVKVKSLNNQYKIEGFNPYTPVDYKIESSEKCSLYC